MKDPGKSSSTLSRIHSALFCILAAAASAYGQNDAVRNNPYVPSPAGKAKSAAASHTETNKQVSLVMQPQPRDEKSDRVTNVNTAPDPEANVAKPLALTDLYKVGVNDVLYIKLQNAVSGPDYYTVRPDGSIDFPLAGEKVIVAGLTVPEIDASLRSSIKLYSDPRLEIKIREYGSHKVTVTGSVRDPGDRYLQREAVPFYVIKSGAIATPEASSVKISSGGGTAHLYDLNDPKLDGLLITPGTAIEFLTASAGSYFVTGKKVAAGERSMTPGLTLLQAVIAAGKTNDEARKAIIRRRNSGGILSNLEFDLRAVRSGRIADPRLMAGDIIDIPN